MVNLTIQFPNEEIMRRFAVWMCDGGGEDMFAQEDGLDFDYFSGGDFLANNKIIVSGNKYMSYFEKIIFVGSSVGLAFDKKTSIGTAIVKLSPHFPGRIYEGMGLSNFAEEINKITEEMI